MWFIMKSSKKSYSEQRKKLLGASSQVYGVPVWPLINTHVCHKLPPNIWQYRVSDKISLKYGHVTVQGV